MNKQQLVDAVGEKLGDRKAAATAVEAVLDTVSGALADGERVSLFGFGVFEKVDRAARTARNPSTGGTVQVPATSVPRFRAGRALKDAVNGGTPQAATSRASASERAATAAPAKAAKAAKSATQPAKAKAKDDGKKAKGKADSKDSKAKGKKARSK